MKTKNRYQFDEKNHVHTLDGRMLTGTSSVSDVLAKPLTWWASGLAVKELGIPDPKLITKIKNRTATPEEVKATMAAVGVKLEQIRVMTADQYYKLLDGAYRAHTQVLKDTAQAGTDLHAECERFVKDHMNHTLGMYDERIAPFVEFTNKRVKRFLWSEVHCYSEVQMIGGISDCGFEDVDGKFAIMDFKSSKDAYTSQFWQCAGYDIQISENGGFDADGNQTLEWKGASFDYYAVFPFGMAKPIPKLFFDPVGAKEAFLAEVLLYRKLPRD
jgi:hypothetical protein